MIENDRIRILDYIYKMAIVCRERIGRQDCARCMILREQILSLYKMLKDLMHEAKKEYFEDMMKRIRDIEPLLRGLLIRVIVTQGGLRLPEIETKEEVDFTYT